MIELQTKKILSSLDDTFDVLFSLESIIKMTHNTCRDKEIYSIYYDLPNNYKITLSEERNNYINMLTLALDKISNLKELNLVVEKEISSLK